MNEVKPAAALPVLPPPPIGGSRRDWLKWVLLVAALLGASYAGLTSYTTQAEVKELKVKYESK